MKKTKASETPKKKVSFKKWEENVRKARSYVMNYDKARWVIVDLALEVCDYSHGGRKGESTFTLAKFAQAIDINRKTLYEWSRIKRCVVDKLPTTIQAKIHTYNYSVVEETMDLINSDDSPKYVYNAFKTVLKRDPNDQKMQNYIRHVKSLLYFVSKPLMMKDVEPHNIEEMQKILSTIQNLIAKEVELRAKFGSQFDKKAERLNIKKEVAQRMKEAANVAE